MEPRHNDNGYNSGPVITIKIFSTWARYFRSQNDFYINIVIQNGKLTVNSSLTVWKHLLWHFFLCAFLRPGLDLSGFCPLSGASKTNQSNKWQSPAPYVDKILSTGYSLVTVTWSILIDKIVLLKTGHLLQNYTVI